MIETHIDAVPPGTLIYNSKGIPLGWVRNYIQMNGNGKPKTIRHLETGRPGDRFAYQRDNLYRAAKSAEWGKVYVKGDSTEAN